jgi:cytochrome c biogenesis protein CcmG, thiol:disulfide interchange protein DsbE
MKKSYIISAVVAATLGFSAIYAIAQQSGATAAAPKAALELQGKLLDGKPVNLADSKGKVTVVQFWATWCPTCVSEMPAVQAFYDANKGRGLNMVSVSIDDSAKEVKDWIAKNPYQLGFAWTGDVQHNLGKVKGTPTFVVIGKDGQVLKTYRGGITKKEFAEITALL